MNTQELFNKAASHLLTMKTPARNREGTCMYRVGQRPNGRACAVGVLITNEIYKKTKHSIECRGVTHHLVLEAVGASIGRALTYSETSLLSEIQATHDEAFQERADILPIIAADYGLEMPSLSAA